MIILNENNFLIFAAQHYKNYNCETNDEFEEDISRFKYIKKLFFTFQNKNDLKERLILNHIIILYNVFEARACTKMLMLKMKDYYEYLFPFLIFLGYMPSTNVIGVFDKEVIIKISDYQLNQEIVNRLRMIKG